MDVAEAARILNVTGPPEDTEDYRARCKTAWKAAAAKLHPDRAGETAAAQAAAQAKFMEAKTAYERLLRASRGESEESAEDDEELVAYIMYLISENRALKAQMSKLEAAMRKTDAQVAKLLGRLEEVEQTAEALAEDTRATARAAQAAARRVPGGLSSGMGHGGASVGHGRLMGDPVPGAPGVVRIGRGKTSGGFPKAPPGGFQKAPVAPDVGIWDPPPAAERAGVWDAPDDPAAVDPIDEDLNGLTARALLRGVR